ncbi:jg7256 [Pararge aegeria aegeria]|uniref:Jg7256 protein n=1 Tax=Pararge aegeria aegeria TaxID=348720 RepID=A0A8S4SAR1_9NEOP|nr:jg7256 [Pararge aegeria aegeria]
MAAPTRWTDVIKRVAGSRWIKRLRTVELGTPYKRPSSGRLSVDVMMMMIRSPSQHAVLVFSSGTSFSGGESHITSSCKGSNKDQSMLKTQERVFVLNSMSVYEYLRLRSSKYDTKGPDLTLGVQDIPSMWSGGITRWEAGQFPARQK